jgi:hypothetical protein
VNIEIHESSKKSQTFCLKHGGRKSFEKAIITYKVTQRQNSRGSNFQGISYLRVCIQLKCLEKTHVKGVIKLEAEGKCTLSTRCTYIPCIFFNISASRF